MKNESSLLRESSKPDGDHSMIKEKKKPSVRRQESIKFMFVLLLDEDLEKLLRKSSANLAAARLCGTIFFIFRLFPFQRSNQHRITGGGGDSGRGNRRLE